MSIKSFVFSEMKNRLPLFIVFTVFSLLYAVLSASSFQFTIPSDGIYRSASNIVGFFAFFPLVFAFVYPLTIFSYRYSKSSTDFYYSLPIDKRVFKRGNAIVGLIALVAIFTSAYLFGSLVLLLKCSTTVLKANETFIEFHFEGLLISYPFLLLSLLTAYGISFFFSSLGYGQKDKILLFIFGNVCLFFNPSVLYTLFYFFFDGSKLGLNSFLVLPTYLSLSPIANYVVSEQITSSLCSSMRFISFSRIENVVKFVFYWLQIALSVLGFIYAFNKKERSGEAALTSGAYDTLTYLIPHLAFLTAGIYISFTFYSYGIFSFYILPFFLIMIYFACYYFALVWYYKRLKISKKDLIFFISGCSFVTVLAITFAFLAMNRL